MASDDRVGDYDQLSVSGNAVYTTADGAAPLSAAAKQQRPNLHLPSTELNANGSEGDTAQQDLRVPSGLTFRLWALGTTDASGAANSNVELHVDDGGGTSLYSDTTPSAYATGTPLASLAGAGTVHISMVNTSGSSVSNISLQGAYTLES